VSPARRRGIVAALVLSTVAALTAGAAPSAATGPYPTSRVTIGTSVQGRPIYAYRIGNPLARTRAVLIGQLHGDEPAVRTAASSIVSGSTAYHFVDLWVVPTANPDGAANHTRKNAHGVDLNRNFSVAWKYTDPPASGYYQGPSAFSEPESRALAAFLRRVRPKYVIGMHQPLYGVDSANVKDWTFQHRLVVRTGLPSKAFNCNGGCRGTVGQWLDAVTPGSMITVELSGTVTASAALATTRAAVTAMWP
jgi:protein MpaA